MKNLFVLLILTFSFHLQIASQCSIEDAFEIGGTITSAQSMKNSTTTGDLNNDGYDEVVYSQQFPQVNRGIYIYPNIDGVLGLPIEIYLGSGLGTIECFDLDQDGLLDIVVNKSSIPGSIRWFRNLGDFQFSSVMEIVSNVSLITEITAADFDNDGDTDLAVARDSDNLVSWIENRMSEDLDWLIHDIAPLWRAYTIAKGDLDHDGDIDLVAGGLFEDKVISYLNQGNGSFTEVPISNSIDAPHSLALADFNGNGNLDVIVARNNAAGNVTMYSGNGDGSFTNGFGIGFINASAHVAAIDYNCDGVFEVAIADEDGLYLYYQDETNIWMDQAVGNWVGNSLADHNSIAVGHINSPESWDIITCTAGTPTGVGISWTNGLCQCAGEGDCIADFNDDETINATDLLIFLGQFGTLCNNCEADLNDDGSVNAADLLVFLSLFGTDC